MLNNIVFLSKRKGIYMLLNTLLKIHPEKNEI